MIVSVVESLAGGIALKRLAYGLICLSIVFVVTVAPAVAEPRQPSAAEIFAVELVAAYLDSGAAAWWSHLADQAPLRRLGRQEALAEIAVRAGPPRGASWRLQTAAPRYGNGIAVFTVEFASGIDDTIVLEIDAESRKLRRVASLADPPRAGSIRRLARRGRLRNALVGVSPIDPSVLEKAATSDDPVVLAWLAQHRIRRLDGARARILVHRLPASSDFPLAALLRGRLAALERDLAGILYHYDEAIAEGWDHDGIRLEKAAAVAFFGEGDRARQEYEISAALGSREADVYYRLAGWAMIRGKPFGGAPDLLRTAWQSRPRERSEILADPALAYLAAEVDFWSLFELTSPAEPLVRPSRQRAPLKVPPSAGAILVGDELTVTLAAREAELQVPGGGPVAPANARSVDAATDRRRRETEALRRVGGFRRTDTAVLVLPAVRRDLETAAKALADQRRWRDLVRLTDDVVSKGASAGELTLGRMRAQALVELGRDGEALALLVDLASSSPTMSRDPISLYQLAELCADRSRFDLAIRMLRRADAVAPPGIFTARIRQFELDRKLEASYERFQTRHFELRFPASTSDRYAMFVGALLEAERERLLHYFPVAGNQRIEVHLFPLVDFLDTFSRGTGVIGLFDGKLRLPFADAFALIPLVGRVLSHELAHAMIAEYTADLAPKWLHEGLAQHIQPEQDVINPIPELVAEGRLLAFPLIEDTLAGFSEPRLVGLAYDQAAWVAHYLEAEHRCHSSSPRGFRPGTRHRRCAASGTRDDPSRARPGGRALGGRAGSRGLGGRQAEFR